MHRTQSLSCVGNRSNSLFSDKLYGLPVFEALDGFVKRVIEDLCATCWTGWRIVRVEHLVIGRRGWTRRQLEEIIRSGVVWILRPEYIALLGCADRTESLFVLDTLSASLANASSVYSNLEWRQDPWIAQLMLTSATEVDLAPCCHLDEPC